jgi:hypothetical protein
MALQINKDAAIQSLTSLVLDGGQLNDAYRHFWMERVVPMLIAYVHLPNYDARAMMRYDINDMLTHSRTLSRNNIDHIVDWVNQWLIHLEEPPKPTPEINAFFVLIRHTGRPSYEILLEDAYDKTAQRFYKTFPSKRMRKEHAGDGFDWLPLAKGSPQYPYASYAAIRIFEAAGEAEAMRQRAHPTGAWVNLREFIAGAQAGSPAYGLRIKGYMTDQIVPHLNALHPEVTGARRSSPPPDARVYRLTDPEPFIIAAAAAPAGMRMDADVRSAHARPEFRGWFYDAMNMSKSEIRKSVAPRQ